MIEIHPLTDSKRERELLEELPERNSNARVLMMTENGAETGYVAVDIKDNTLRLLSFSVKESGPEREFYLDTLMRSAASFGEENGADRIESISPDMNTFLSARRFDTDEQHAFTPMSTIVHYDY